MALIPKMKLQEIEDLKKKITSLEKTIDNDIGAIKYQMELMRISIEELENAVWSYGI